MNTLIINNGSGYIKFGQNNYDTPTFNNPCLMPENFKPPLSQGPIRNGTVYDWDSLTTIWESLITKSNITPEEYRLLITLPLYEIMFEYFNFKSVYIGDPNCLTLYSSGRTSGLIYDCGHHLTQINPVYEGYHLHTQSRIINFGGQDLDDYLLNRIKNSGILNKKISYQELHKFKHQLNHQSPTKYQLPDGQIIMTDKIDISMSELLFKPSLLGKDIKNCGLQIAETIKSCDLNTRNQLQNNVILSGGTTLVNKFSVQLNQCLSAYLNKFLKP